MNISRQDISSQALGLRYAARFEKTSGASNRFVFINMSEGALSCVGKQVTLSFWIRKGPNLTSGVAVSIGTRASKYGTVYNSGDFGILNSQISSSTFTRFTSTFNITSATADNNADLFELEFSAVQAGSTGSYFDIAGVQLEVGNIATPFSRAASTLSEELSACQRYFVRYEKTGGNQTYFASGNVISTTRSMFSLPLPVNMRATPSIARTAGVAIYNNGSNYNLSALSVYQSAQNILNLDGNVSSGLTNNTSSMLSLTANGDYLDFSAEL
jgi:hypothetical protein